MENVYYSISFYKGHLSISSELPIRNFKFERVMPDPAWMFQMLDDLDCHICNISKHTPEKVDFIYSIHKM